MYEIKHAGAKGLGVFSTALIPRGTRIFSEHPLFTVPPNGDILSAFRRLSEDNRFKLMQLSPQISKQLFVIRWTQVALYTVQQTASDVLARLRGRSNGAPSALNPRSIKEHMNVLSIFRNNNFNLGNRQAVFPRISRLNHSCMPNAQGNFNEALGRFTVHATRDIVADEELTINYLPEHGSARETRQNQLQAGYGFACECPACDVTSTKGRESEQNRLAVHEKLRHYAEEASNGDTADPEAELRMTQTLIALFEDERLVGRELSSMYLAAGKLNEALGRHEAALHCVERGLDIDRACLGTDNTLYQDGVRAFERLLDLSKGPDIL